jgi:hypothetical protein
MNISKITSKQDEILKLIYQYRYLDRIQIQKALGHKDKRRILAWLKDLRQKQYVEWIYSTDFVGKTKPAIYYIGINGIRYLKALDQYPTEEVRKRYRDNSRSRTFIDKSLLIADCNLALETAGSSYKSITEANYIDQDHYFHFLAEHDILRPSLLIQKQTKSVTKNYLLEIFDATLPRYRMRRRLKAYVTYLDDKEWEGEDPQPIVLLVCPSVTDLIYAKRATKKLIEDTYADEGELRICFTTTETLKNEGITAKIWEEGRLRHSL